MSDLLPPPLATLGFADTRDVDERALRRAYARLLKQIDVEAEPDRFQALRETLDDALRWLATRDRARPTRVAPPPAAADPVSNSFANLLAPPMAAPPTAAPPPATPDAEAIGSAVYASFHQSVTRVFRDVAGARAALDQALADARLINIDARTAFEGSVARLLADGWRPGHDHLLDPAAEVFGWARDHTRLAHFGQVGALLDAALRDRAFIHQFDARQTVALDRLLLRIRDATPPDPGTLREEVQQLQYLVQRAPNWLRIVSPVDPVNARFEMWRQSTAGMQAESAGPQPKFVRQKPASATLPALLVIAAVVTLAIFGGMNNRDLNERVPQARTPGSAAADADLAQRQRRAEALLSNIQTASPAPSPWPTPKAKGRQPAPATAALPPPKADADKPWWAPEWAGSSGAQVPDMSPPTGIAPAH